MELVYLGFFEKICNFVAKKILHPIFEFLTGLINSVFTWLFNNVLAPILLPILKEVLNFAIDIMMDMMSTTLYFLFSGLLKILDYLQIAFDVFIGLSDVEYTVGGNVAKGNILKVLLQQGNISKAFWIITFSGLLIALVLTMIATAKSAFDLDFEGKRPVSKVLTSFFRCFIQFLIIPFSTFFILEVAGIILKTLNLALGGNSASTLGRTVFVVCSLNAAKDSAWNSSGANGSSLGTTVSDTLRYPYYNGTKSYTDLSTVRNDFDLSEFDYLIGIVIAIFLLVVMGACLVVFVQRIFEIILLYVASPYFVAMMPLDDGEKFSKWKELFMGKVFTGYGSVMGMRLYLMICPIVMGNQIRFMSGANASTEMEYVLRLFFLVGGAWAVYKSGSMITTLISWQAGHSEAMTTMMAGGAIYGATVGTAMSLGRKAVNSGMRRGAALSQREKEKKEAGQAFTGSGLKDSKAGGIKGVPDRTKTVKGNTPVGFRHVPGAKTAKSDTPVSFRRISGAARSDKPVNFRRMSGVGRSDTPVNFRRMSGTVKGSTPVDFKKIPAVSKVDVKKSPGMIANFGSHVGLARDAGGKKRLNLNFGGALTRSYDENGNKKVSVLGMSYTENAEGKRIAERFPLFNSDLNKDGKLQVSKVKLPGIATMRANTDSGKLYFSDVSMLGIHIRREGQDDHASSIKVGPIQVNRTAGSEGSTGARDVKVGPLHINRAAGQTGSEVSMGGLRFRTDGTILNKARKDGGTK